MEEQVKNIVAQYIKIPAEQIAEQTVIDRSAVASSIILHRMYAQLQSEGISVNDYSHIKTYGQLVANINGNEVAAAIIDTPAITTINSPATTNELPVGIDMENIFSMPVVNDFREDAFYKMNFAPAEIAYCILQTNPYASFAGLFAAKEAIIKADNAYKNKTFNTILIDHLPEGKPVHPGFQLSITHTNDAAVAVAVKNISLPALPTSVQNQHSQGSALAIFLAVMAFMLSLIALILFIFKSY